MLRIFKQYYPIRNAMFVLGEGIFIYLSVIIASLALQGDVHSFFGRGISLKALLITAICQTCLFYNDLYDLKITDSLTELGIRLLQSLGASAIVLAVIYFIFPGCIIGRGIFIVSITIVIVMIVAWRVAYTKILSLGMFNQKVMLLGSSDIAKEIYAQIIDKKDCGYEIKSIISKGQWNVKSLSRDTNLILKDDYSSICKIAEKEGIRKIIVALKQKRGTLPVGELLACRIKGIEILEGNSFYEMLTGKLIVESMNPGWLIFSQGFQKPLYLRFLKRTGDIVISLTMLIILLPAIAIIAVAIKLDSNGPVLFSQERIGRNRKSYMAYKFRSMRTDAEKYTGPVWARENDDRITRIGGFMRKWRIDEIPQLWNVLKGEMSFVGPRPEREHFIEQLEEIIPYYGVRVSVKPGLTGWAQVSYGYGASVEDAIEKLNYDLFYIKNLSFLMDMMIVARTVKTVLFGHGR